MRKDGDSSQNGPNWGAAARADVSARSLSCELVARVFNVWLNHENPILELLFPILDFKGFFYETKNPAKRTESKFKHLHA